MDRVCEGLVAFLLLAQVGGAVRQVFVEDRFFAWSPHDSRNEYRISAFAGEQPVSAAAIEARYGLLAMDWHALGNVKTVIRVAEERAEPGERWRVVVTFRRNLGAPFVWTYPE
jgi:hypothetical protein